MYWAYLQYVIRHKWFVFLACLRRGNIPLIWRGIIHDWHKLTPAEFVPYAKSFYGPWAYKERPQWLVDAFDRAWLKHQHRGSHHYQHWILREDSGSTKALEMPWLDVAEMIADWEGAGRAINGKADVAAWYASNREKIVLHDRTRMIVEHEIGYTSHRLRREHERGRV